jgi:secondary thiamine-phosphate synthase enzyme
MKIFQQALQLQQRKRGFHIITMELVQAFPQLSSIKTGMLQVFIQHTSASLTINENADPTVRKDFETYFSRTVPENDPAYLHNDEGPDDMPAHLRAALTNTQLSIPLVGGRLALGTWQGIYLFEHRRRPHHREVALHLLGD